LILKTYKGITAALMPGGGDVLPGLQHRFTEDLISAAPSGF
jgi:hypothetical protein